MLILLLAYLGGVLTILSPCILPVLPFVFSRTGQRFTRSGLPLLAGMALTFALVATLASVGGAWVVSANQYGRWLALALLALFGLALLLPRLAERLAHPLVRAGDRLSQPGRDGREASVWASLLLGVATGLLWAPCAGPILGLVLTGAALQGANLGSTALLLAYALGAATSLAAAPLETTGCGAVLVPDVWEPPVSRTPSPRPSPASDPIARVGRRQQKELSCSTSAIPVTCS